MGVFVSEQSAPIGPVCVRGGRGRGLGSLGLKVKCRHGSIELGIERAEACRMGFWGLGNQCDGSEDQKGSFVNPQPHARFYFLSLRR